MTSFKRIAILTMALIMTVCCGCGNTLYEKHQDNYTIVTSVDGVEFDMPENFLAQATAITNISKDEDYSSNTYLYKDGENTYLLFNIGQVVVAVENQTGYRLQDATDMEAAITQNSLDGIWFSAEDKKISYETEKKGESYKLLATVKGDVSVTTEVYGVFVGQFAYVSTGDYECSMFVGVRGESYSELDSNAKSIVEHIAKSLTLTETAATLSSAGDTEESESTVSDTELNAESSATLPTESSSEQNAESTESLSATEDTESVSDPTELPVETETVENTETVEIIAATERPAEEASETEATDIKDQPAVATTGKKTGLDVGNNQGAVESKYSDIYHLLSIGMTGTYFAYDKDSENSLSSGDITIEQLYTGEDAIRIIKDYCASGESMYEYADAPKGYSWHAVKYSLSQSQNDLYTNIKIEGLDGERLVYRGVSCTTRTYDIIYDWDSKTDLYCYYAVPNGCKEYMLECGNRYESTSETACYRITGYR